MLAQGAITKSTLAVLEKLAKDGPLYPKEISDQVGLAPRTVTLALRNLLKLDLCRKVPNFADMRKPLYHADIKTVRKVREEMNIWLNSSAFPYRI